MNKAEKIVKSYLELKHHVVTRMSFNYPDFFIDNLFYVEVKNLDSFNGRYLSNNQEHHFAKIDCPIYIYYVKKQKVVGKRKFERLEKVPSLNKTISVTFEDDEIKYLEDIKAKRGLDWRKFILTLVESEKG